MKEIIYRHTCDQCGKVQEEKQTSWLNCGGAANWCGFDIQMKGAQSAFYSVSTSASKEFCCYDCAIEWMKGQK